MSIQYKISVITINKNNAPGLKKTCLSVITQTSKEFEWIIIDGASDDNSVDVIKQYSENINFWISEPDSGIYNAMNKGIEHSTGEYLLFLNSGDFLLYPWTLQDVIDEIKTLKYADVYFSNAVYSTYQVRQYPKNINLNFFIRGGSLNHQNCLIKRELFKHRLYDENYPVIADWYFFLKEILDQDISFIHILTNIAMYDMNGISATYSNRLQSERRKILKKLNISGRNKFFLWSILKTAKYILPYGLFLALRSFRDYLNNHQPVKQSKSYN